MSAPVPNPAPQPEQPAKKSRFGKKEPKPPKVKKPRQPWGMAPWLLLAALLTGGAAVAALYVPIPGLTAKPTTAAEAPKVEKPASPADTSIKREQEVAKKELELAAREDALKQKEADVARLVKELGVTEVENSALKRAASMYANMAPFKAAPLMAQLDDNTAVQILRLMSDEEAAAILANMAPDRGAQIMRELAKPPVSNPAGG